MIGSLLNIPIAINLTAREGHWIISGHYILIEIDEQKNVSFISGMDFSSVSSLNKRNVMGNVLTLMNPQKSNEACSETTFVMYL